MVQRTKERRKERRIVRREESVKKRKDTDAQCSISADAFLGRSEMNRVLNFLSDATTVPLPGGFSQVTGKCRVKGEEGCPSPKGDRWPVHLSLVERGCSSLTLRFPSPEQIRISV